MLQVVGNLLLSLLLLEHDDSSEARAKERKLMIGHRVDVVHEKFNKNLLSRANSVNLLTKFTIVGKEFFLLQRRHGRETGKNR